MSVGWWVKNLNFVDTVCRHLICAQFCSLIGGWFGGYGQINTRYTLEYQNGLYIASAFLHKNFFKVYTPLFYIDLEAF